MTYHLTCPICGKEFSREYPAEIRRVALAVFKKDPSVRKIWIRDGRKKYGYMKKVGRMVYWKTAYKRKDAMKIVNEDGTLRRM